MIYPVFAKKNDVLGVCAPSAGVGGKLEEYERSLGVLESRGYRVKETASVRNSGVVSADARTRADEFMSLVLDGNIRSILCATGGDFMMEMLPHFDFSAIVAHPKWIQGYSDVTNILYPVTTLCDIATVYGCNAAGYDDVPLHEYQKTSLDFLSGNISQQHSFDLFRRGFEGDYDVPVSYNTPNGDFTATGRLLGGCLDLLSDTIAGTRFDGTRRFIERYRGDGVIWYFDVFSKSSEQVALALWQLSELGWFEKASAFVFGRVCFPSTTVDMTYEEAAVRVLGKNANIVTNFDVGHVAPKMTMINGAKAVLTVENGKGSLKTDLIP